MLSSNNSILYLLIYIGFAQILIKLARPIYIDDNDFRVELNNVFYAFYSTATDFCHNPCSRTKVNLRCKAITLVEGDKKASLISGQIVILTTYDSA